MKLKHIHIDSYKVFQDFDLDLCHDGVAQNLVVIAGVNGNGKTTLLRDVIAGNNDSADKPKGYVTIEDEGRTETFTLPASPGDEAYRKAFGNVIFYGADDKSSVDALQKEILRYVDKFVYVMGKTSFDAYRELQALMQDLFADFNLQVRFKGINQDKQLVFTNLNQEEFGVEGLSDGEQKLLSKVFPLFTDSMQGHVILMDEPEDSLHPSWQARYIPLLRRCAKSNDCQFVLATHSPQIISAARQEEIRIFTRDEEGHVRAGSCADGPYGWTVEKVLGTIQGVKCQRVPEVESRLEGLRKMLHEGLYDSEEFKKELADMEAVLGYSDRDLVLIRMEVIRKNVRLYREMAT